MKRITFSNLLLPSLIIALAGFSLVYALEMQSKTLSEPLGEVKSAEVRIELGLAEVSIGSGDDENLVVLNARYDSDRLEPVLEVQRDNNEAYVNISMDELKKWKKHKDSNNEYDIRLSPIPVYKLKCEIGLGDNTLDLSGLKLERIMIESGLAETDLILTERNPIRTEKVEIESGLGEFNSDHLGFLQFDQLEFEGGLGSATIDLRGFEGEGEVYIAIGLGNAEIILPKNVGVRLSYEENFLSGVDLDGFIEVGKDRYESENYNSTEHRLHIELEVGLGSTDVYWKD